MFPLHCYPHIVLLLPRVCFLSPLSSEGHRCSIQLYGDRMLVDLDRVDPAALLTALVRREAAKVRSIMLHLAASSASMASTTRCGLRRSAKTPPRRGRGGTVGDEEKAAATGTP